MIQIIEHQRVREVRLDRPPVNALTTELILGLNEAVQAAPREGAGAIVLSGSLNRFSGGLDVPLLLGLDRGGIVRLWRSFYALLGAIAQSEIPIAAAITGHAPAGGTVLALYCDWRVMAQGDYLLGLNEVQVGIPLPPIIVGALRRLVGPRRAEELGVSGALLSPSRALDVGLVDELAPPEQTVPRAIQWCEKLLALPPGAMTATRRETRADLITLFRGELELEMERIAERWWLPETQATLRALAARLQKKVG